MGILSLALAAGLIQGVAVAAPVPEAVGEKPAAPPRTATEAADLPSAQVAARLSGKRVEALSERTESSTTWANPDGSVTLDAASGPVRFRDGETDEWRDIDIDLVKKPGGEVAAEAHPLGLKLAGRTPAAKAAKVRASGPAGETQTLPVPLVALEKDKQILGAKLNLWNFHSWSCSARSWEVWTTNSASTATRWTAQPSWNKKWATSTATKGFPGRTGPVTVSGRPHSSTPS
ncbi:hypothetical protein ACIOD0_20235 [Kitasatospora albolonga]